nr:hypothetical protein [uncultured bacterium]
MDRTVDRPETPARFAHCDRHPVCVRSVRLEICDLAAGCHNLGDAAANLCVLALPADPDEPRLRSPRHVQAQSEAKPAGTTKQEIDTAPPER